MNRILPMVRVFGLVALMRVAARAGFFTRFIAVIIRINNGHQLG